MQGEILVLAVMAISKIRTESVRLAQTPTVKFAVRLLALNATQITRSPTAHVLHVGLSSTTGIPKSVRVHVGRVK